MLFPIDENRNLLPRDGELFYFQNFLTQFESSEYIHKLIEELDFKNDETVVFGKHRVMNRLTAWVGDRPFIYGYSQIKRKAQPWSESILFLKSLVEARTKSKFNSCLLNYYPSGEDGMGWHADDERELGKNPVIASISLGAERKFSFKHIESKEKLDLKLKNGSLLLMSGEIQHYWKHTLPKSKKVHEPRLNLTFREIITQP
ncbi:MAG: alpha-ketoglutarate-dependent dioxygenase AlkB [Flavobacteriales bacterium]|nr:alpha-ketoglutarate-dependent dioxygenase AlkB [Flavobacteriales bacterium]|tara:strand:- start:35192 stop:35797 length:606 start_codon:yes stop_codon:yes gene_type:complete